MEAPIELCKSFKDEESSTIRVAELIKILEKLHPTTEVGLKAACCPYEHNVWQIYLNEDGVLILS